MTAVRGDLLELTPEALTALANAGFVKRAQKDVAAGLLPLLETADDGTVSARFDDGVRTSLPPGRTLRDAQCSCPAGGYGAGGLDAMAVAGALWSLGRLFGRSGSAEFGGSEGGGGGGGGAGASDGRGGGGSTSSLDRTPVLQVIMPEQS